MTRNTSHGCKGMAALLCPTAVAHTTPKPGPKYHGTRLEFLESTIRKHHISSVPMLKKMLQEEWLRITPIELDSMPRRLQAVIDANGGPNKY